MQEKLYSIITTIQSPTRQVRCLSQQNNIINGELIIIGDRKTPVDFMLEGARFVSLEEQLEMSLCLSKLLPENHYSRKNIGYLIAIREGAKCVYETDDDNEPNGDWQQRAFVDKAISVSREKWFNPYRQFSDDLIWPRGFPLDCIGKNETFSLDSSDIIREINAPVQQGLVDNSPDVDAVWRLLLDKQVTFKKGKSIYLRPGTWCPFNSQNTWWWQIAFPLLYLPSYCSFRMTDIWRSFIAQRCLWELDFGILFYASDMIQERNLHNLMQDFKDEVPGYLGNNELTDVLSKLSLKRGLDAISDNLIACYTALVDHDFFPQKELPLIDAWLLDLHD